MKRRAMFGQWKTPPHMLYPSSSGSGMKKSTSMPAFNSLPPELKLEAMEVHHEEPPAANGAAFDAPKRAMSYQDFNNSWAEPLSSAHARHGLLHESESSPGGKRPAQALERPAWPSGGGGGEDAYVNPRNALLRDGSKAQAIHGGGGEPRRAGKSGGGGGGGGGNGGGSGGANTEQAERMRKLARNRALARMRRIKKKNMADRLELESEDLQRMIAMLGALREFRQEMPDGFQGFCGYPRAALERAYAASQNPVQSLEESEAHDSGTGRGKGASEEERQQLANLVREQLVQLETSDLREMLRDTVVAGKTQEWSIHSVRRKTAVQLFLDNQIAWAEMLRAEGVANSAPFMLLAQETPSSGESSAASYERRALRHMAFTAGSGFDVSAAAARAKDGSSPMATGDGSPRKVMGIDTSPSSGLYSEAGAPPPLPPGATDERVRRLRQDLAARLQITPQQREQLAQLARGMQQEQLRLHALSRAAALLSTRRWVDFPTVEQIQEGFQGFLLANQMDKFKAWSTRNIAAIDALDFCPEGADGVAQASPLMHG